MAHRYFVDHTVESAPAAARPSLEAVIKRLGYLPVGAGRLAASPPVLDGFLRLSGLFETTTLDPVCREVVIMTVATRNGCRVTIAIHTARLADLGADPGLISALREERALGDDRLEGLRAFTLQVLAATGAVGDEEMDAFLVHGFTPQNALEVVLGVGAYTLSTFANRLTGAPVDDRLTRHA